MADVTRIGLSWVGNLQVFVPSSNCKRHVEKSALTDGAAEVMLVGLEDEIEFLRHPPQ